MDVSSRDTGAVDDPESADAGDGLDLTPRATRADAAGGRRSFGRRLAPIAVGVVLVGAIAAVAAGLAGATTYFYNVDEAVARRDEIGDRRVRLQGNIIDGTVRDTSTGLRFTLAYGGERVEVRHSGDVPDLFGPEIPVVIEGRFAGDGFRSDRALVKHDETYDEENTDRIRDAERDARRNAESSS